MSKFSFAKKSGGFFSAMFLWHVGFLRDDLNLGCEAASFTDLKIGDFSSISSRNSVC